MEVLLTGNTGYLTERFLDETFPGDHVIIYGECAVETKKNILKLRIHDDERDHKLLQGFEFDRILYFSYYLTLHGNQEGEMDRLRRILQYCRNRETQFLYVTGPEGGYVEPTGKTVLVTAAENLCLYYSQISNVDVKILRSPYLYSATYHQDTLFRMFAAADKEGELVFSESEDQRAYFICMDDLGELLYRIFDRWVKKQEVLSIPDSFHLTFRQIGEALKKEMPGVKIVFSGESRREKLAEDEDGKVRTRYGWFPRISPLEDIQEMYAAYQETREKKKSLTAQLKEWAGKHKQIFRVLETGLVFFAVEFLNKIMGHRIQFQFIDLRLLFIVAMGTIYGINMGILAAALSSCALLFAYGEQGTSWMTIFYEPSNWLPFIFYFTIGSICGYIQMKNRN